MIGLSCTRIGVAALVAFVMGSSSMAVAEAPFSVEFDWGKFTLNAATAEKVRNGEKLSIGYVSSLTSAPAFNPIRLGLKEASAKYGFDHDFVGPNEVADSQLQASIIETLVRAGIDGLIVNCDGSDVLAAVVNGAIEAGVPTVTSNIDCPASNRFSFYGQMLVDSGRHAGTQFIKYFRQTHPEGGGPYKVALFAAFPAMDYARDRIDGFKQVVSADDIEFVGPFETTVDMTTIYNAVEATFKANPDLDGIYSTDEAILGGGTYIKRNGFTGQVTAVGFNFTPGIPELIQEGAIQASIGQYLYKQGWNPVEALHAFFNGTVPDCELCDVGADILNTENIEERLPQLREESR